MWHVFEVAFPVQTLFPIESLFPEGFAFYPDFIGKEEEVLLLEAARAQELQTFVFQGYEAKRRVASFGQDWSFERRSLAQGKPVPGAFLPLLHKVAERLELPPEAFAELLVTEYPPGSVINWHRDAPPFALIAGVSLASDATFRLRPYDKALQGRRSIRSLHLPRRSLYVMQGPARSEWEHSIAPVKTERFSITLRTLY
ncbi:MAG: alpha-ketoglutarate-dependent dioxygenase AlkB [Sphingobacteriales bacterium]|nr:MAG: alpha-ketoglutarate-dependent dioxygenase AlkB [Sphingobacteriales bacterium]